MRQRPPLQVREQEVRALLVVLRLREGQKAGAEVVYGAELASHTGYKYFGAAKAQNC